MTTALSGRPEPKRRFIPSKWEHKKVRNSPAVAIVPYRYDSSAGHEDRGSHPVRQNRRKEAFDDS